MHLQSGSVRQDNQRAGCPPRGGIRKACGAVPGRNVSERRAGPERLNVGADPPLYGGRPSSLTIRVLADSTAREAIEPAIPPGYWRSACLAHGDQRNTGSPKRWSARDRPTGRPRGTGRAAWGDGAGPQYRVTPGNAGRGKGPEFKTNVTKRATSREIGDEPNTSTEGSRSSRTALHPKRRTSPSYRFYCLYDKVYRASILELRLRSLPCQRRGPGVDGQTFEDIEAYGARDSGWTNWRRNSGANVSAPARCADG